MQLPGAAGLTGARCGKLRHYVTGRQQRGGSVSGKRFGHAGDATA